MARGSAGLSGNFGNSIAPSSDKGWRVVDGLTWQTGPTGGMSLVALQSDKAAGLKTDTLSICSLVSCALTRHFMLVGEAGSSTKMPEGQETQKLAKFPFAPTLSIGSGFWRRPELRFCVTTAKWNSAANVAAGAGGVTGIGDGKTKGTSYSAQFQIWS